MRSSREQFDRQAQHYNTQWNEWSESSLQWLLEHAALTGDMRVLDVATGTGFTARAFAPHVSETIGLDVSPGMLAQARAAGGGNITYQEGAAEQLPFPDASFDRVTCRVAPHHFTAIQQFVDEAFRVLKPGGKLLIADTAVAGTDPEVDAWQNQVELLRDPSHICNYSPAQWRGFLLETGFRVDALELLTEANPIELKPWLEKGGCSGAVAEQVTQLFRAAPAGARAAFHITDADGEIAFRWLRVALAASKPD